jgi:hypothetical protein
MNDARELQALASQDRLRLAIAQNIAANGRLFSVLLVAVNLVAYLKTGSVNHLAFAILSALPVGASCLIDQIPGGRLRLFATAVVYTASIVVVLLTLLAIG